MIGGFMQNNNGFQSTAKGIKFAFVSVVILFSTILYLSLAITDLVAPVTKSSILFVLSLFISQVFGEMLFSILALKFSKIKFTWQELGFTFALGVLFVCSLIGFFYYNDAVKGSKQFIVQIVLLAIMFNSYVFSPVAAYRKVVCKYRPDYKIMGKGNDLVVWVSTKVYLFCTFICLAVSVPLAIYLLK